MMSHANRPSGLRFLSRRLATLLFSFTASLSLVVLGLRLSGTSRSIDAVLVILVGAPWLLGVLVLAVERKGAVTYWAAPFLLSLTTPAVAVCHNWGLIDHWRKTGEVPDGIVSLLLNAVLIGACSLFYIAMSQGCCPRCGHRCLIPLRRFWLQNKRTARTRWCGSCGAQYWRDPQGLWQKERRATWIDAKAHSNQAQPSGDEANRIKSIETGAESPQAAQYGGPRLARTSHRSL
jgi:transcription elongation factor Elf1